MLRNFPVIFGICIEMEFLIQIENPNENQTVSQIENQTDSKNSRFKKTLYHNENWFENGIENQVENQIENQNESQFEVRQKVRLKFSFNSKPDWISE